jgi:hypothetical protein
MSDIPPALRRAHELLEKFLMDYGSGSLKPDQLVPDLAPIMDALDGARQVLKELPPAAELDSDLEAAVNRHVNELKQLAVSLEKLKPQLESRREEVRARLGKIRAALNWANSFRQTQ